MTLKKIRVIIITVALCFLCACSSNIPEDFNLESAKTAVANYYLHHFIMIDADTQITYIDFDEDTNTAEFFVSESVEELFNGDDFVTGTFYVYKDATDCYIAKSANPDEIRLGIYRPASDIEENTTSVNISEEYSSVLADNNMSNAEKNDMISQLAQKQLDRAESYRVLIKEKYKSILNEYKEIGMSEISSMSYDKMCKALDEYFDSLKNEFESNVDFFEKQAYALCGTGTAGASYLVNKEYECAKSYADKAQAIYEELR